MVKIMPSLVHRVTHWMFEHIPISNQKWSWNITQLYFRWCFWMFPAINLRCVGLFCRFPSKPQPPAPSLGVSSSLGSTRDPLSRSNWGQKLQDIQNIQCDVQCDIQYNSNDSKWVNMIQPFPTTIWGTDRCGSLHSCLSEFPFRAELLRSPGSPKNSRLSSWRWPNLVFPKVVHLDARNVGCWPFVHHHFTKVSAGEIFHFLWAIPQNLLRSRHWKFWCLSFWSFPFFVGMRSQWKPTAMTTAVEIFMFVAETHMFLLKSQSLPLKSHFWISSIHHQFSRQNLFFSKINFYQLTCLLEILFQVYMEVSWNGGIPKSSIYS